MKHALKMGIALLPFAVLVAQESSTDRYTMTSMDSSLPGNQMGFTVPSLVNAWGLASMGGSRTGSAWFVADNGSGLASIITGEGDWSGGDIIVLPAGGTGIGRPAGVCVPPSHDITFATLDGTISSYLSGSVTIIEINNSATGAVYTACTRWGPNGPSQRLYVANSAGGIEAYDPNYNQITLPQGAFIDPEIPADFAPYGIWSNGERIWVSYFNGTPGPGHGYVDVFDENGALLSTLQHGNWMNQPFGMVLAPAKFAKFSKALLVAMTGSGKIAAFNPQTGTFAGYLESGSGEPIAIPGIHGIGFGNGAKAGPTTTLYFAAGIVGFTQGLFGSITANAAR